MLRMAMWSKAAPTLESLENRSVPGRLVALKRPLAARMAWGVSDVGSYLSRAPLTLTI